jgi:hypothetical protein
MRKGSAIIALVASSGIRNVDGKCTRGIYGGNYHGPSVEVCIKGTESSLHIDSDDCEYYFRLGSEAAGEEIYRQMVVGAEIRRGEVSLVPRSWFECLPQIAPSDSKAEVIVSRVVIEYAVNRRTYLLDQDTVKSVFVECKRSLDGPVTVTYSGKMIEDKSGILGVMITENEADEPVEIGALSIEKARLYAIQTAEGNEEKLKQICAEKIKDNNGVGRLDVATKLEASDVESVWVVCFENDEHDVSVQCKLRKDRTTYYIETPLSGLEIPNDLSVLKGKFRFSADKAAEVCQRALQMEQRYKEKIDGLALVVSKSGRTTSVSGRDSSLTVFVPCVGQELETSKDSFVRKLLMDRDFSSLVEDQKTLAVPVWLKAKGEESPSKSSFKVKCFDWRTTRAFAILSFSENREGRNPLL